jgi:superfamily I DNA and RNA helicase
MSETKQPFANNQQQMLAARVEWEINQMIFPHVKQQADHGYPFATIDDVLKECYRNRMEAMVNLDAIGSAIAKMQPEYNDAFSYIAFREINNLVSVFLELAEQRARTHPRNAKTSGAAA